MMEIERDIFSMPWSAGQMKDSLLAAHCQTWGVYSDETALLMGFGILSIVFDEAEILNIGIAKSFQRQGYGKKLLRFLLEKAAESKVEKVFLEVPESHHAAIFLYEKAGFEKVGLRAAYYETPEGIRETAVLMRKNLDKI